MALHRLAAVFGVLMLFVACGGGPPKAGEGEFNAADKNLTANNKQFAFGNGPVAQKLAESFNLRMKLMLKIGFKNTKSGKEVDDEIITYCNLTDDSAAFLVYIPALRNYKEDAQGTLLDLAWPSARGRVEALEPAIERKLAVGLRGTLLYGASAFGTSSADEPEQKSHSGTINQEDFYPFFTGAYPQDVAYNDGSKKPATPPVEAATAPGIVQQPTAANQAMLLGTTTRPADANDSVLGRVAWIDGGPEATAVVVTPELLATIGPLGQAPHAIKPLRGPDIEVTRVSPANSRVILLRPTRAIVMDPLPIAPGAPQVGAPVTTYYSTNDANTISVRTFSSNIAGVDATISTDQKIGIVPQGAPLIDAEGRLIGLAADESSYVTAAEIRKAIAAAGTKTTSQ